MESGNNHSGSEKEPDSIFETSSELGIDLASNILLGEVIVFNNVEVQEEIGPEAIRVEDVPSNDNGGEGQSVQRDRDDEKSGGEEAEKDSQVEIRKGRAKFKNVTDDEDIMVENMKTRTRLAKLRGKCLLDSARLMEKRTGAKVFLKAQYQGSRAEPYNFFYGKDFEVPATDGGSFSRDGISSQEVRSAVKDALEGWSPPVSTGQKETSQENNEIFLSPSTRNVTVPRRRLSNAGCFHCGGVDPYILVKGHKIPALFFTCSKTGCKGRVHNECIGFPNVSEDMMKTVATWLCPIHSAGGRPPLSTDTSVDNEDLEISAAANSNDQPTPSTSGFRVGLAKTRGSSTRRGRGSRSKSGSSTERSRGVNAAKKTANSGKGTKAPSSNTTGDAGNDRLESSKSTGRGKASKDVVPKRGRGKKS